MKNIVLSSFVLMGFALILPVHPVLAGASKNADDTRLAVEREIAKLPAAYAWAVDGKDIDAMMSIFSQNAVYDLSDYGFPSAVGQAAIRAFFLNDVFQGERCSFSSISNVRVDLGRDGASGADYFIHFGYNDRKYPLNTRHHVEGQHFYRFVKERGEWKISHMRGHPTFEKKEPFDPAGLRHCP